MSKPIDYTALCKTCQHPRSSHSVQGCKVRVCQAHGLYNCPECNDAQPFCRDRVCRCSKFVKP